MDKIISIGGTNDPNTITINSNLNREIINYKVNTSIFQNGSLSNMLDANGNNVLELLNHTAGSLSIDKIIKLYNKIYNISSIVGNTPTTYTNELLKYTGKKVLESYLGFTYNDIHSSVFGLTRINKDNMQSYNLSPNFKDNTIEIPGKAGFTYYDTQIQKFDIKVVCGFEGLTSEGLRAIKEWLAVDKIGILTLDEEQYKNYRVKISAPPSFSFIPFDANRYYVDMAEEMSENLVHAESTIRDTDPMDTMATYILRSSDSANGLKINHAADNAVSGYISNGNGQRTYNGEITITFSCLDGYGYTYEQYLPPKDETNKYFQTRNSYLCIGDFKPEKRGASTQTQSRSRSLSQIITIGGARAVLPSQISSISYSYDTDEWTLTTTTDEIITNKKIFTGTILDYDSYQGSKLYNQLSGNIKDYNKFYYDFSNDLSVAPQAMLPQAGDDAAGDSSTTTTTIDDLTGFYLEDNSYLRIINSQDTSISGTTFSLANHGNIYTYPEFEFFYSERVDDSTDTSGFVEIKDTPVTLWIRFQDDQNMILKFNLEDTKSGIKIDCQRGLIWKIKNKSVGGIKKYWSEPSEINGLVQDALVYGDYIKMPPFGPEAHSFSVRCQIGNSTNNTNQCLIMKTRVPSRYR